MVFVFGGVRGDEIVSRGVSVVGVEAAGQPAEIRFAFQRVSLSVVGHEQRQFKLERNHGGERRVKMGVVVAFALLRDDCSQASVMAVVVALPGAFPAAGQLLLGVRVPGRFLPLAFEAASGQYSAQSQQNDGNRESYHHFDGCVAGSKSVGSFGVRHGRPAVTQSLLFCEGQ